MAQADLGKVRLTDAELSDKIIQVNGGVRLGKDADGKPGYVVTDAETGADTVVPFKSGSGECGPGLYPGSKTKSQVILSRNLPVNSLLNTIFPYSWTADDDYDFIQFHEGEWGGATVTNPTAYCYCNDIMLPRAINISANGYGNASYKFASLSTVFFPIKMDGYYGEKIKSGDTIKIHLSGGVFTGGYIMVYAVKIVDD